MDQILCSKIDEILTKLSALEDMIQDIDLRVRKISNENQDSRTNQTTPPHSFDNADNSHRVTDFKCRQSISPDQRKRQLGPSNPYRTQSARPTNISNDQRKVRQSPPSRSSSTEGNTANIPKSNNSKQTAKAQEKSTLPHQTKKREQRDLSRELSRELADAMNQEIPSPPPPPAQRKARPAPAALPPPPPPPPQKGKIPPPQNLSNYFPDDDDSDDMQFDED